MTTRYMFLIYGNEAEMAAASKEEWDEMLEAQRAWGAQVQAAGATIVSGDALGTTETSTTVRKGSGAPTISEGPAAHTEEALEGYYVIDCTDRAQALKFANALPASTVELRPVAPTM